MATQKLTVEQLQAKLNEVSETIAQFSKMGIAVPAFVQEQFDELTKKLEGNNSNKLVDFLNEKVAVKLNGSPEFVKALLELVGERSRVAIAKKVAEDGTLSIVFERPSAGQKPGTSNGNGTKSATQFSGYVVTVSEKVAKEFGYKEATGSFTAANKALQFILNNGKNPLNLGAEYGTGNSAVRVLFGTKGDGGICALDAFKSDFTIKTETAEAAKTAETPEAAETPETAEATETPAE